MNTIWMSTLLKDRFRWVIVGILFLLSVTNYLNRQTLSVLAPSLIDAVGMTQKQYSYIVSLFLVAYTISFAIAGWALDRFGARVVLPAAVAFWSVAAILHGAATGWIGLAVCRILLGLGEGFGPVGGVKVIGEWVPKRERALAMGIFSNGNIVGAVLGAPLVVFLQLHFGWRSALIITGFVGIFWIALWRHYYAPPVQSRFASEAERNILAKPAFVSGPDAAGVRIWSLPITYGVFIARLLTD